MESNFDMGSYHVKWDSPSKNSGESMPVGGHDIGCNVWVEGEYLYLYMAQSGAFDEAGRMDKAGRIRIGMQPFPFVRSFCQELVLEDGYIRITGENGDCQGKAEIWCDTYCSCIHIELAATKPVELTVVYESWRSELLQQDNPDIIDAKNESILFVHRNHKTPVLTIESRNSLWKL